MPRVSICIPTYVQTKFLQRNFESILAQGYKDYEIIITDDTPDQTIFNFLQGFDFGEKLQYVKNEKRLGSPENWNEAIRRCSGDLIKILHHDDWFSHSESLSRFVELMDSDPSIEFAFSGSNVVFESGLPDRVHSISVETFNKLKDFPEILLAANLIGSPSATIFSRRITLEFDRNLKWLVDLECYMRMIKESRKIAFTSAPLISTITDAEHSVTKDCENNKEVELFEYFYVYNSIQAQCSPEQRLALQNTLIAILRKYNVKSVNEISPYVPTHKIPLKVWKYVFKETVKSIVR